MFDGIKLHTNLSNDEIMKAEVAKATAERTRLNTRLRSLGTPLPWRMRTKRSISCRSSWTR
ncbi:hypothetical protein J3R82DRAFT_102 [Butyriboletus roseoflavus]|nr:hypothetical protein J3R82DRAFT_102 [Butyriboletus roseoflavus]